MGETYSGFFDAGIYKYLYSYFDWQSFLKNDTVGFLSHIHFVRAIIAPLASILIHFIKLDSIFQSIFLTGNKVSGSAS